MKKTHLCLNEDFERTSKSAWPLSKTVRVLILGPQCEICGKTLDAQRICGHHIGGRRGSSKLHLDLNHWQMCQLRCPACELTMHKRYPLGNNRRTNKIQVRNNVTISLTLRRMLAQKTLFLFYIVANTLRRKKHA